MYTEQVYKTLHDWSERALLLIRNVLPRMKPIATYPEWSREERRTVGHLLGAAARTSESALLLTSFAQLWDAEIMVRSVFEGSLKFAFLLQDRSTFPERYKEYRRDLFRIALLKQHDKAQSLFAALPDPNEREWLPLREQLLSDAEREEIMTDYPKRLRSQLDQRWGFSGIIGELGRSGDPLLAGYTGLAHSYAIASHIIHADHVGTSVPAEIDFRTPERRDAQLLAHGARLISDVMACVRLRLAVGYRYAGVDARPLADVDAWMDDLRTAFDEARETWMTVEYPGR